MSVVQLLPSLQSLSNKHYEKSRYKRARVTNILFLKKKGNGMRRKQNKGAGLCEGPDNGIQQPPPPTMQGHNFSYFNHLPRHTYWWLYDKCPGFHCNENCQCTVVEKKKRPRGRKQENTHRIVEGLVGEMFKELQVQSASL